MMKLMAIAAAILAATTPAIAQIDIDPNDFASGQAITTAPGVTLQTETFIPTGTTDAYGNPLYTPVFTTPVFAYNDQIGCVSFLCPPVGTNVFAPSPTGIASNGYGETEFGKFWGGSGFSPCQTNCIFNAAYQDSVYLKLTFTTPVDYVSMLALSTGGDPTLMTAFDSAGNTVGGAEVTGGSSTGGWGDGSITTATTDIYSVIIGGDVSNYQAINEIAYAYAYVPEIDPATAASGLTLFLGGLLVLRGRRKRGRPFLITG